MKFTVVIFFRFFYLCINPVTALTISHYLAKTFQPNNPFHDVDTVSSGFWNIKHTFSVRLLCPPVSLERYSPHITK